MRDVHSDRCAAWNHDCQDSYEDREHLTYHMHNYCEEVWTVVAGKGKAIVDGMEQILRTGDVITIAAGCKHMVEAIIAVDIIEVQFDDEINVSKKLNSCYNG